ncbi:MAG: hypothetical protein LUD50_03865 [Clostridia bacterium]|nr:hypothetical protein [Clostridia bacterium]
MRKLAHIEKIEWKRPIEGADRIELVGVLGWQCIANKDEFNPGDLCVYIEIDSVVDKDNPDFAFLEKRKYKIKTIKMKGVLSQGIVFPVAILHDTKKHAIGEDVTGALKITEIEDVIPKPKPADDMMRLKQRHRKLAKNRVFKWFMKFKWFRKVAFRFLLPKKSSGKFPDWISKTDEIRLQNMPEVLEEYKGKPMVVTEKIDGTSSTYGLRRIKRRKYEFVVCSRNVRQEDMNQKCFYDDNFYWVIAFKYKIQDILTDIAKKNNAATVILQGETVGPGIQDNKYRFTEYDIFCFNLIIDGEKTDSCVAKDIMAAYGMTWVPILDENFILLPTVDEMLSFADGKSVVFDTLREGVVIRDHDNTTSFKCISNKFLLKHNL